MRGRIDRGGGELSCCDAAGFLGPAIGLGTPHIVRIALKSVVVTMAEAMVTHFVSSRSSEGRSNRALGRAT